MKSFGFYINGHFVQGSEHQAMNAPSLAGPGAAAALPRLAVLRQAHADSADFVEAALEGASLSFQQVQTGSFFPLSERLAFLSRLRTKLAEQSENLALLMVQEVGKPLKLARQEVGRAILTVENTMQTALTFFAPQGLALEGVPGFEKHRGYVTREGRGPLLAISPFNYPINLVLHKLAPAWAAGCPVILKPSPKAQLTALTLVDICHACELPAGMLSLLPCDNDLTQKIAHDPRIAQISFTGSAPVGWKIAREHDKPICLELGGNAPVYVDAGANLALAAKKIATGALAYAGQVCISVQNIDVHEQAFVEFSALLKREVEAIAWGNPFHEDTLAGPVIDAAAMRRLSDYRAQLLAGGAQVFAAAGNYLSEASHVLPVPAMSPSISEAEARSGRLNFLRPEIFVNVPLDHPMYREELFGPYAALRPVGGFDEWLARVNAQEYRLQCGVFSADHALLRKAGQRLQFGGVLLNEHPGTRFDPMPYGGRGRSGRGREGARYALEEFTEYKAVVENTDA